jgi:uncharacterized damage-inducible protein DinB
MADAQYFQTIRQLAEYEVWCNERAIEAASRLNADQLFRNFGFGLGTVHATLFHTIEVFQTWSGCVGPVIGKPPMRAYDPTMQLQEMTRWNASLSEAFLDSIDLSHASGLLHIDRRLAQVFHLITHGTHHRTQCITMLRLLGIDPPYESGDFGGWSREQK